MGFVFSSFFISPKAFFTEPVQRKKNGEITNIYENIEKRERCEQTLRMKTIHTPGATRMIRNCPV